MTAREREEDWAGIGPAEGGKRFLFLFLFSTSNSISISFPFSFLISFFF
jgi:hypothetical protein